MAPLELRLVVTSLLHQPQTVDGHLHLRRDGDAQLAPQVPSEVTQYYPHLRRDGDAQLSPQVPSEVTRCSARMTTSIFDEMVMTMSTFEEMGMTNCTFEEMGMATSTFGI